MILIIYQVKCNSFDAFNISLQKWKVHRKFRYAFSWDLPFIRKLLSHPVSKSKDVEIHGDIDMYVATSVFKQLSNILINYS